MSRELPPPLYVDAFMLAEKILRRLAAQHDPLSRALSGKCLNLLEVITLALKGRSRDERIEDADERLIGLRAELRLAIAVKLLGEVEGLAFLEIADRMGRQLGGWRRSLGAS